MQKKKILLLLPALLLASCGKGIEKEYDLEIKEIVVVQDIEGDGTHKAAHCKKSMSLFNYYVVLTDEDAAEAKEKSYKALVAKETDKKSEYKYGKDKVSDHGYVFVKFKE